MTDTNSKKSAEEAAETIYRKMFSYANPLEVRGVSKDWIISKIKEGLQQYASQSNSEVDGWVSQKPVFDKECVFITAQWINKQWYEYTLWEIKKVDNDDGGWYLGWLNSDGEEYGDINDLSADLYKIIDVPKPPKQ